MRRPVSETSLQTSVSVKKECSRCWSRDSPKAREDDGEAAVPLQSMEVHGGSSPWMSPHWRRWMPEGGSDPTGN